MPKLTLSSLRRINKQTVLLFSFTLIAALTIGVSGWLTARILGNYLEREASARLDQGMSLAQAIYQDYLVSLISAARRTADYYAAGASLDSTIMEERLRLETKSFPFEGNRFIVVLDAQGNTLGQDVFPPPTTAPATGNWGKLPIVVDVLTQGRVGGAIEVLPVEQLGYLGLDRQANVALRSSPQAAPTPFDPREGSAGLILLGSVPIVGKDGKITGAVLAGHLLNNDAALVDRIRDVGKLDAVTFFFGDLRVSASAQAIGGQRALGLRLAQEIGDVVLGKGNAYEGRTLEGNERYLGRYEPLRDQRYQVIGNLHVGLRESVFTRLLGEFRLRLALIALATIALIVLLSIPIVSWLFPLPRRRAAGRRAKTEKDAETPD